ncbi:alpha/beta hydrolase family protein [Nitrosomonas sp. HPC101]|uniref:alpha/beta hydrolase n=1 Tax=Nitrosomonas sp. HPC101 TaxID=1658667 RepID=UPI0013686CFA|nr:alpha/beta family hydrolase [Nitrosomonas sp. HPC101]MXS84527.1 alpha/beta hydrolase family protein [Nitrosomonas sp. HPC101]
MPNEQKRFVTGPAGRLETVVTLPEGTPRGLAVVAHPHPLYQGSMDNKIVYILTRAFIEQQYITVKFNFRGVGKSEGSYAEGKGEIEDVLAITRAMREQYDTGPEPLPLTLAGFSFGGGVQAHVAQQLKPDTLVLVAPAVERLHAPPVVDHARHILIIQGDQDTVVPLQSVLNWATPQTLPVTVIPGAEHFFHGKLPVLKNIILQSCSINQAATSPSR